jgi:DUF177 domain-containing protein
MSGGAAKLRDVRKLADSRAVFELDFPLLQLPGLPAEFTSGAGSVRARLSFGREQGFAMAQVELTAQLAVTCQRCLSPLLLQVQAGSPVLIAESEREAEHAPAGWETFLAPEGRVDFAALAAEELLLALPIVPLHEDVTECARANVAETRGASEVPSTAAPSAEAATTRPFADLRALLERDAASRSRSRDTSK